MISSLIFILGLVFGSFTNVLIYRIPRNQSFISGRSKCPNCDHVIPSFQNIPIISYLFLRGKCAICNWKIPISYPIVELLFAILWIWGFQNLEFIHFIWFCIFSIVLVSIAFIDLFHLLIPVELIISASILNITGSFLGVLVIRRSILGLLVAIAFVGGIYAYYTFILKKESIGGGDVLLSVIIGWWLGYEMLIFTVLFGAFLALLSIPIFRKQNSDSKTLKIPFGFYLSLSSLIIFIINTHYKLSI